MSALGMSHVAFCVRDLERSLAFYRDALGFRVRNDRVQETTTGGLPHVYKHRRDSLEGCGVPPPRTPGRRRMDAVTFHREVPVNVPTLVTAFGGWIDAGEAATGALRHLVHHLAAPRLASMDPEEFFVLTLTRPTVRRTAEGPREVHNGRRASSLSGSRPRDSLVCSSFAAWSPTCSGTPTRSGSWTSPRGAGCNGSSRSGRC
jgi:catechol 2,3-dioxygenase-like lactoylglutathione lyase family enzyme